MTAHIRKTVISALHTATDILNDPDLGQAVLNGADLDFDDIDIDSLSRFELIMHVEDALDLELDDDDLIRQTSLNQLIAFLETSVQSRDG